MNRSQAEVLIKKYIDGTATQDEKQLVEYYFHEFLKQSKVFPTERELQEDNLEVWDNLSAHIGILPSVAKRFVLWQKIASAAAVILVAGAGWLYFSIHRTDKPQRPGYSAVIRPGRNVAVLELANGKKINLSSKKTGVVIKAGDIAYNDGAALGDSAVADGKTNSGTLFTTVRTPKGGMYQVELSDGTKVWLNAASSLRFPSSFAGNLKRSVELEGEGYFEVSKDKNHPFQVRTSMQEVEVLGTHFNIDAYGEDATTKTTLLEGRVAVSPRINTATAPGKLSRTLLSPDQQSMLSAKGIVVNDVDSRDAIAWKEGYFLFNNEDLGSIMQRLSRWYDTKIIYEDESLKRETLYAKLSRYERIDKILKLMEKTEKVRFKVEGNTITISRKQ
ncbi:FecR family protein [Mucilaginibacter kameinonensis]|uniref:FecR family protein n=1 Tax=Mucilaginibacter kameinonensis TaxID=452286 RepID=UPI000EF7ABC6|nr:FecR family protein [Mucilaginibacter kameinonensis]